VKIHPSYSTIGKSLVKIGFADLTYGKTLSPLVQFEQFYKWKDKKQFAKTQITNGLRNGHKSFNLQNLEKCQVEKNDYVL